MSGTLDAIKHRCAEAGLDYEEHEIRDSSGPISERIFVSVPEANGFRQIMLGDDIEEEVVSSEFEKFKFIKGYRAVWSSAKDIIECELATHRYSPEMIMHRKLWRILNPDADADERPSREDMPDRLELESPIEGVDVSIGRSSLEHAVLVMRQRGQPIRIGGLSRPLSIRFDGPGKTRHDDAKEFLQRVSNAVLFKLDLLGGWPYHLRSNRNTQMRSRNRNFTDGSEWSPPRYEYDPEPMSLYWYGRTASDMPLLQFLSYYQVLEFYFPVYSYRRAQEKIRNIIRDPRFNVERDADIASILDAIEVTGGGRSYGDERDQMKATVSACVRDAEISQFIKDDEEREEFYEHRGPQGLSDINIPLSDEDQEILPHIASRLYQIRCRIVHSKKPRRFRACFALLS